MSKRVANTCGFHRTSGARVASYPGSAIYSARAQECTSRGSAGGSLSLALGIISLAIVIALALGLRDAVAGTWPKNGLVVVTYVPVTPLQEARSAPPIDAQPKTREVDLSVDQVRALLDHNEMADAEGDALRHSILQAGQQ